MGQHGSCHRRCRHRHGFSAVFRPSSARMRQGPPKGVQDHGRHRWKTKRKNNEKVQSGPTRIEGDRNHWVEDMGIEWKREEVQRGGGERDIGVAREALCQVRGPARHMQEGGLLFFIPARPTERVHQAQRRFAFTTLPPAANARASIQRERKVRWTGEARAHCTCNPCVRKEKRLVVPQRPCIGVRAVAYARAQIGCPRAYAI